MRLLLTQPVLIHGSAVVHCVGDRALGSIPATHIKYEIKSNLVILSYRQLKPWFTVDLDVENKNPAIAAAHGEGKVLIK